MDTTSLQLQLPTNRTVAGPRFRNDGTRMIVEYDYQQDDGTIQWSQLSFEEVLAFEYRQEACCSPDDVLGAHEVRCLAESKRLSDVLDKWLESVGWEEWHQEQGGASRFRHFTVFFDDAGCINVVAASCAVA